MPPNFNQTPAPVQLPKNHVNHLIFPLFLVVALLLASLGFGAWAYMSRQDYKANSDAKSAAAVAAAEKAQIAKDAADFAEREKNPLKTYKGSSSLGSLTIKYPKTWSVYIEETARGNTPLNGYMHPGYVPSVESGTAFALHFEVTNSAYDVELAKYDSETKAGAVTVGPQKAPKVKNVTGVRIEGEVERGKQGVTVLLPLRDKTLKISTESKDFIKDFNAILSRLTFVP